jgi:spermidine synthase
VAAPIILPLSGDETAHAMPWRDARVLSAASGLLVFGCEVVFAKLLGSVVGTSAYAFGLMLAIFLVCLSLGTPLASRLARSFGASAAAVGLAASGITLAASLAVWDRLPALFVALGPFVQTWGGRETIRGLAALAVLVLPVVAMGTTFPLALRAARHATVGADVGRLTVANTLGSIAGSIAFGFQILPRLDANRSLLAIAIMYLALAGFAIRHRRPSSAPAAGGASGSSKRVAIDLGDG